MKEKFLATVALTASLIAPHAHANDLADFNRLRQTISASSPCKPDTKLSNLPQGISSICYNGRKAVASVAIDKFAMDGDLEDSMASMEAMSDLIQSKCPVKNGKMHATTPGGISQFTEGNRSYAIAPEAVYNKIQCR